MFSYIQRALHKWLIHSVKWKYSSSCKTMHEMLNPPHWNKCRDHEKWFYLITLTIYLLLPFSFKLWNIQSVGGVYNLQTYISTKRYWLPWRKICFYCPWFQHTWVLYIRSFIRFCGLLKNVPWKLQWNHMFIFLTHKVKISVMGIEIKNCSVFHCCIFVVIKLSNQV